MRARKTRPKGFGETTVIALAPRPMLKTVMQQQPSALNASSSPDTSLPAAPHGSNIS
jgi:hypothetical protein